jgi:hypothetical protein
MKAADKLYCHVGDYKKQPFAHFLSALQDWKVCKLHNQDKKFSHFI